MKLNEQQKKAVTCPLGPTMVIAGPGSGKTQVICQRVSYMIQHLGCSPSKILVVTFSKLAAQEMQERYIQQFEHTPVQFGTLHSVFYRILRSAYPDQYPLERLLMEDKIKILLEQLMKEADIEEGQEFVENFIKHLSLMKNQLIAPRYYEPIGISKQAFLTLVQRYEAYKARQGLFDFDDMLVECYYALKEDKHLLQQVSRRYQYVLVDEFQDINLVQFEILKLIVSSHQQIFVVGDDDQSIYQFRGAKPEYLLDFKKHFKEAKIIYLTTNYRCSGAVLEASLALIKNNKNRYAKDLITPNSYGTYPHFIKCENDKMEALHLIKVITERKKQGIPLEEMAVIYRTNLQARPIVEQLIGANIPFCLRDGMISLYDQWITKDILAYFHLAHNVNQSQIVARIINKPKRYMSKVNIELAKKSSKSLIFALLELDSLSTWQKDYLQQLLFDLQALKQLSLIEGIRYMRHQMSYDAYLEEYATYRKMPVQNLLDILDDIEDSAKAYEDFWHWEDSLKEMAERLKSAPKKRQKDMLTLTTMHGAKGLEFNTVFIIDVIEGIIPYHKSLKQDEIEEERRLLYVGMTRAKEQLYLYTPKQKHGKVAENSPFIGEIQKEYLTHHFTAGKKIRHRYLGEGVILKILPNDIWQVKWQNGEKRKINSIYCLNNAIITWEGDEHEKK